MLCMTAPHARFVFFFFSSRRRHTRYWRDWSSDVCSSDLFLGDTVGKIAAEKAGIFKAEVPAIVAAQPREALAAIERQAARVRAPIRIAGERSEEHTSELQSRQYLVCRLLLEKKKKIHRLH